MAELSFDRGKAFKSVLADEAYDGVNHLAVLEQSMIFEFLMDKDAVLELSTHDLRESWPMIVEMFFSEMGRLTEGYDLVTEEKEKQLFSMLEQLVMLKNMIMSDGEAKSS